jgi:hypothetical protein
MTRQEIENLGQAMLTEHGLHDWCVLGVYEEDDTGCGDEDDIGSAYGRTFFEEKLIWVDMKCADDSAFVREILLHEIAHALIGEREGCARRSWQVADATRRDASQQKVCPHNRYRGEKVMLCSANGRAISTTRNFRSRSARSGAGDMSQRRD